MFENVTYIIEPLATSSDNEHIIFQANTSKIDYLPLQQNQHFTQYASNFYKILDKSEVSEVFTMSLFMSFLRKDLYLFEI